MRYVKYLCNYHFVWIPKYRKDILVGEVAEYTKEVLKSIAEGLGCEVSYPRPEGGSLLHHSPTMPPPLANPKVERGGIGRSSTGYHGWLPPCSS